MKDLYQLLKEKGFEGVDIDLEVSLEEYCIVWKKEDDGTYSFINKLFEDSEEYIINWNMNMDGILDDIKEWEDGKSYLGWLSFVGRDDVDINEVDGMVIYDLISYYGIENILGSIYSKYTNEEVVEYLGGLDE